MVWSIERAYFKNIYHYIHSSSPTGIFFLIFLFYIGVVQLMNNPPEMQETPLQFLDREEALEKR